MGLIRCAGCGKTIGEMREDGLLIAYKGRAILIARETEKDVHVTITCEKKSCGTKNRVCIRKKHG